MSPSFDGGCGEYAASDQNIDFEVIESNGFENMVERISVSGSAYNDDSDGKTSAQIEPHQVSKGNGIFFILFLCNCPQNIKRFARAGYVYGYLKTHSCI